MSLQSDAENIMDLCAKIINFEILRARLSQGSIQLVEGNPDTNITLTAQQKQALLAIESSWQTSIKAITATWP